MTLIQEKREKFLQILWIYVQMPIWLKTIDGSICGGGGIDVKI